MRQLRSWWPDVVLLAAFTALTVALVNGHLLTMDVRIADWVDEHRPTPLYWLLRVFNYLGQGGQVLMPVTLLLTALLFWRRRSWRVVIPFAVVFVLTYITIGPLKIWLDRAAPHFAGPDREILFNPAASGEQAMSYPSGHVANALAWYFVIALLLRELTGRDWSALRLAPPVIVLCTTTYLAFHWITDSVAGLLLGLVLARVLGRVPWDVLLRSRTPLASRV